MPDGVAWAQAGGFPENYTTAHDALFTQCGLGMGERVCIHGAAGGVGTAAVELAAAAGCDVVATVRNEAHRERAWPRSGATVVAPDDFVDPGPFDVILELVGAANMPANLDALAAGGRIAVIGVGAGFTRRAQPARADGKRGASTARPCGPGRSRTRPPPPAASSATSCRCWPAGAVTVPIAATFPLSDAAAAVRPLRRRRQARQDRAGRRPDRFRTLPPTGRAECGRSGTSSGWCWRAGGSP